MRLVILILLLSVSCTVKYIKEAPTFEDDLKKMKRLTIYIPSEEKGIGLEERKLLQEISRNYISHHKEFIIYPAGSKMNGECMTKPSKSEGILQMRMNEVVTGQKVNLSLSGKMIFCRDNILVWEGLAENSYPINPEENASLVKTYTEKISSKIAGKVTPYFKIVKALIDELKSPVLSKAEETEKIEVDSED